MTLSVDALLNRMPGPGYFCLDFTIEAWEYLTGDTGGAERLRILNEGLRVRDGRVILSSIRGFRKLSSPVSPCFAVMQRAGDNIHIGVYYNGRVLHMQERGAEFQSLQVLRRHFMKIGFYQ
jgi:hypothetical protein